MLFFNFSSTEYIIGISNVKIAFFSFVEKLYVNKVSALMYKQNNPLLLKQTASEFIRFFSIQLYNSKEDKNKSSYFINDETLVVYYDNGLLPML